MSSLPTIALVGRPNVGKSRLFNRLVGRRVSIVHDQAGVTRDIIIEEKSGHYILMDTGGLGLTDDSNADIITEAVENQVKYAFETADLVIFLADALDGVTVMDETIINLLRKHNKPTLLVVNKIDTYKHEDRLDTFYSLGLGSPIAVSAEHGRGIAILEEEIEKRIGPFQANMPKPKNNGRIRISLAGRANVGKSSLINRLLKTPRLIVSDIAGTTRDSVRTPMDYVNDAGKTVPFELVDTAGLKARKKLQSSVDYFSCLRTEQSMENSDVVLVVLDAQEGISKLDKKLVGTVAESGKGLVIVVNKWDKAINQFKEEPIHGYDDIESFKEHYIGIIKKEFYSLPSVPIVFVSALEDFEVESLLEAADFVYQNVSRKFTTSQINQEVEKLFEQRSPSVVHGKRFKIYYGLQTSSNPLSFRFYCNQSGRLDESYKRYLHSGLIKAFNLVGCSILFEWVGKKRREDQDPKQKQEQK